MLKILLLLLFVCLFIHSFVCSFVCLITWCTWCLQHKNYWCFYSAPRFHSTAFWNIPKHRYCTSQYWSIANLNVCIIHPLILHLKIYLMKIKIRDLWMQQSLVSWPCFPRLSACKGSVIDISEGNLYCKVQTAVKPISEPLFLNMFMAWKEKKSR